MTEFQFRTLADATDGEIYDAFCEAFSDYLVQMDMRPGRFKAMNLRRGYDPRISMGAFHGDRLVGFILNGLRQWEGRPTAYDAGTGVVPEFRKMGITTNLFGQLLDILKIEGVEVYLLEVIKENDPARELYLKQGFQISRGFSCHLAQREDLRTKGECPGRLEEVSVTDLDWDALRQMWDFSPSWQNSIDSIMAVPDAFKVVIAHVGDDLAGYGVIETASGDIPQIAVAQDHRGKGIGRSMMGRMAALTTSERFAMINVEEGSGVTGEFAKAVGMAHYTAQYELKLVL